MIHSRYGLFVAAFGVAAGLAACKDKPPADLAPTASALAPATPGAPKAIAFAVEPASSKVTFLMDSPLEKIDGQAPGSVSGELFIDLDDISKSTALIKVDLQKLTLYQQKRSDEKDQYTERAKSDLQNTHARDWLQIVPHEGEVTPQQAEANRFVEFKITKVENASASNISALPGAERKITATVSGDFRLHNRKNPKSAKVEITVSYAGDKPESVRVRTLEPLRIGLEEFEVNPRDGAGKFLKTLSEALADKLKNKVAKEAPLDVDFRAKAK